MCEQTPFPVARNDMERSIGYALDRGAAVTATEIEALRRTHDDPVLFDKQLQDARSAAEFASQFAAYVRKQVPSDNADPEGFVLFDTKSPSEQRDAIFHTDGEPCITVYRHVRRPDGSAARRHPTEEVCILAHEFGHFKSWYQQTTEAREQLKRISRKEQSGTDSLTADEKREAMAEETRAWAYAEEALAARGFSKWPALSGVKADAQELDRRKYGTPERQFR
jgi:hypothetical protein